MIQPAIKYEYFVLTRKTTTAEKWIKKKAKGNHVFDGGGWRDYAFLQERGIEFELLDDAKRFIAEHGGELKQRKLQKWG